MKTTSRILLLLVILLPCFYFSRASSLPFFLSDNEQTALNENLFYEIGRDNASAVDILLKYGADVNAHNGVHDTPLIRALQNGSSSIVKVLLKAHPNINAQGDQGFTALHFATILGDKEIMQELLFRGANASIRNIRGENPLSFALGVLARIPDNSSCYIPTIVLLIKFIGNNLLIKKQSLEDILEFYNNINSFVTQYKNMLTPQDIRDISSLLNKLSLEYNLTSSAPDNPRKINPDHIENLIRIYDVTVEEPKKLADPADALPSVLANATHLTQTEAYLSVPFLRQLAINGNRKTLGLYPQLIKRVIDQEKKYNNKYDVFYHGQQQILSLFYDIVREIQNWFNKAKDTPDFDYIRFPDNQNIKLSEFLKRKGIYDHDPEVIKHLLSVNVSLFGNSSLVGENTFHYFTSNLSVTPPEQVIESLFDQLGLDKKYLPPILNLVTDLKAPTGNLLQIFIPKDKVNEYVYLSAQYAKPLTSEFARTNLKLKPITITNSDGTSLVYNLEGLDPATYLEIYRTHPQAIDSFDMDRIQARIHITRDFILNPKSGVKIFRYTTVQPQKQFEYQQKLKTIMKEVMSNWAESNTCKLDAEPFFDKLRSYLSNLVKA